MGTLRIVGRITGELLAKCTKLLAVAPPGRGIYHVFAARQGLDLQLNTRFREASGVEYDLLAVTQQFDFLFDEIPHGWTVILALRSSGGLVGQLAGLPRVDDAYALPDADTLLLEVIP